MKLSYFLVSAAFGYALITGVLEAGGMGSSSEATPGGSSTGGVTWSPAPPRPGPAVAGPAAAAAVESQMKFDASGDVVSPAMGAARAAALSELARRVGAAPARAGVPAGPVGPGLGALPGAAVAGSPAGGGAPMTREGALKEGLDAAVYIPELQGIIGAYAFIKLTPEEVNKILNNGSFRGNYGMDALEIPGRVERRVPRVPSDDDGKRAAEAGAHDGATGGVAAPAPGAAAGAAGAAPAVADDGLVQHFFPLDQQNVIQILQAAAASEAKRKKLRQVAIHGVAFGDALGAYIAELVNHNMIWELNLANAPDEGGFQALALAQNEKKLKRLVLELGVDPLMQISHMAHIVAPVCETLVLNGVPAEHIEHFLNSLGAVRVPVANGEIQLFCGAGVAQRDRHIAYLENINKQRIERGDAPINVVFAYYDDNERDIKPFLNGGSFAEYDGGAKDKKEKDMKAGAVVAPLAGAGAVAVIPAPAAGPGAAAAAAAAKDKAEKDMKAKAEKDDKAKKDKEAKA